MKKPVNLRTRKSSVQQAIDYSVYILSIREWIQYGAAGAALAGIIAYVFYRSVIAFVILAVPAAILFPVYMRRDLLMKRRRRLASEFREGITVLASCLAAGYSMENAMKESTEELAQLLGRDAIITQEFEQISSRVGVNTPIEVCWQDFADRSGIDDIRNFVQVIKVAKRSGGALNGIIARSADTIGDKIQIKEEIITMTAAKRLEQKIMNVIPIAIVVYIDTTSPGFFNMMYSGLLGRIIMTVCLAVYIAAIYISGRILEIEI